MKYLLHKKNPDTGKFEYFKWSDNTGDGVFMDHTKTEEKSIRGSNYLIQTYKENRALGYFFKPKEEWVKEGWSCLHNLETEPGDDI